jgi:hypothetical protein
MSGETTTLEGPDLVQGGALSDLASGRPRASRSGYED